jgi:hypothetical protein
VVGSRVAHVAPAKVLRRVVAVSLVGAGLLIGMRAVSEPLTGLGDVPPASVASVPAASATATVEASPEAIVQAREGWEVR